MVAKFAGVQKCLTHWLKTSKITKNMTLDDSLLILANNNHIFYENDTNEVKGSYHDDCLEKNNNIFCILNWGMAVRCSRNMNFVKNAE